VDIVDRVKAITGRIDLIHANDSKDGFDSGRDRHDNLGSGNIDPDLVVAAIRAAGAPVVVETPGGAAGQSADIAYLRERLNG
jgi:deoxyribonuclease-4